MRPSRAPGTPSAGPGPSMRSTRVSRVPLRLAAEPPLVYWNGATVECLHAVRRLRAGGVPVFFTIDAGPQLKAVCAPGARVEVERTLRAVPGVLELLASALGGGAELR